MKVLVAGGGVAGVHAALEARSRGADVTLVEASSTAGLSRSLLPSVLAGEIPPEDAVVREASELGRRGVEVRVAEKVMRIDHASRTAETDAGRLRYDSLVVATGSSPVVEGMDGLSKEGVFVLKGAADYISLGRSAGGLTSVGVAGSGPLVLSVAESLSRRGIRVDVFASRLNFSAPVWQEVVRAASVRGVRFHGARLESVAGMGRAEAVVAGGEVHACDGVVVVPRSAANLPRVECEAGPGGGALVDDRMRTSLPGLFAAGDCAEVRLGSSSLPVMLHSSSRLMGDVAGRNATGGSSVARLSGTVAQRVFGLELCSSGISAEDARSVGLDAADASASFPSRDRKFGEASVFVSLTFDRHSHRVYGIQLAGLGSLSLALAASAVVGMRLTLEEVGSLESPYLPGENSDISPIGLTAARALGLD